jgi:hypothetical protein
MDAAADGEQRRLLSIPKEGERVIAPTRRPDGTLRKEIRIRAGYVPQDEVAIYQSKGALVSSLSLPRTLFWHQTCSLIRVAVLTLIGRVGLRLFRARFR